MNKQNFFLRDFIQAKNTKIKLKKNFSKKFNKIFNEIKHDVKNSNKTLNVLDKNFKFSFKIEDLKKFKKFKKVAIIGMGGSILGAEAIHNFFQHKIKKKFYFFNNLDEEKISKFKKVENLSKILFLVISKSGNTIETLSNTFSLNIIKKNSKNILLISEKKNNLLFSLSKRFNLSYIEHKSYIGGRYSVLSEVGLIPAFLMGINIIKLRSKTLNWLNDKNKMLLKKSSINLANFMRSKRNNSLIFLNYSSEFENFLFWCQQLIAESLGKRNIGFLPVVSNAPKDHHSLLQLYLDGPKDKLFNIFSFKKKSKEKINISKSTKIISFLNKKKISSVKDAQKKALIQTFVKKNIPFREFCIKKINEETLGELFSFFIIETIIVGRLLDINPYNQPAVEQVKVNTKKLLN